MSVASSDSSQANPFTFAISGVGQGLPTATSLSTSATSVSSGQTVTLTATVQTVPTGNPMISVGSVSFLDDGTVLGTTPVVSGIAQLMNVPLSAGTHSLTAQYSGYTGSPVNFAASSTPGATANSTISTAAGSSTYLGDGGPATAAELDFSAAYTGIQGSAAADANGNLYIADTGHSVVREVNRTTGIMTTIVGTGVRGYSGDGGQATAAMLNAPDGLAFDAAGNLYIADAGSSVVRRVDHITGAITTIAGTGVGGSAGDGGPATSGSWRGPLK